LREKISSNEFFLYFEAMFALLESLIRDARVTDILISSNAGIWIDQGHGLFALPDQAPAEKDVRALAVELIDRGGRHIDVAHPCVDVRLEGGIRAHAVLAPLAPQGTAISIRIPRHQDLSWEKLLHQRFLSEEQHSYLLAAVAARQTILISGAAGAGKTSLLGLLLSSVDTSQRIVVLEDVAELQIQHPHVITLEARQANIEGAGGIALEHLVPQALRMRADRLVLGECRGAELSAVLSALNTGHTGGGLTLHANSLEKVPARLQALGYLSGLSENLLTSLVAGAIDLVVHVERGEYGRRISQMGTIRSKSDSFEIELLALDAA
jgi:pilus assembly protein CpaF